MGDVAVRVEGGALVVGGAAGTKLTFYGRDIAYAAAGSGGVFEGQPYEFVRTASGQVGWIRVNGRVAKKDA
jgi:hypothetical protein